MVEVALYGKNFLEYEGVAQLEILTAVIPNESGNPSSQEYMTFEQSKLLLGLGLF